MTTLVQRALVTGSCVRTGRAIALKLASDGWEVGIHGKPGALAECELTRELCIQAGGSAFICLADISSRAGCEHLVQQIPDGSLDLLVHNVGIYLKGSIFDLSPDDWDRTMATNLGAPFHLTQLLRDRISDDGSIVAVGYVGVSRLLGTRTTAAYSVSKVGLLSLVRSWAIELAERRIRVNMVSPGQLDNSVDLPSDIARRVPLGRAGRPEEIADLVAWLASDKASYITGQDFEVAGGLMLALRGEG